MDSRLFIHILFLGVVEVGSSFSNLNFFLQLELGRWFSDKKYTLLKFPLQGLELSSKPDDYSEAKMFPFDKFRKVVVYIVLF